MVAKANRPDGPFVACNWSKDNPKQTEGVLNFDPAVLVDDDGRVYAYWGIMGSYAAELDPQTMAMVKPGTQVVSDMVPSARQEGVFRFFEASSIRKIKDKYVFIYSRKTADNEFGLPVSNYTLAYAYSDHPLARSLMEELSSMGAAGDRMSTDDLSPRPRRRATRMEASWR